MLLDAFFDTSMVQYDVCAMLRVGVALIIKAIPAAVGDVCEV